MEESTIEAVTIDDKSQIPSYHAPRGRWETITVSPLRYLMIDGHGDPNSAPSYRAALESIFPTAYACKFLGRSLGRDYRVMPLEALWWSDDMAAFTTARDKSRWSWTLMIMVPDWLTAEHLDQAIESVQRRRSKLPMAVRLGDLEEGLAVQTLHLGPYDDEGSVLTAMHQEFLPSNGLRPAGRHHEIYLSDARRTAPERLRTILRQPVEPITEA